MFKIETTITRALRPRNDIVKSVDLMERPGPRFKTMQPLKVWLIQSDGILFSTTGRRPLTLKAKRKGG